MRAKGLGADVTVTEITQSAGLRRHGWIPRDAMAEAAKLGTFLLPSQATSLSSLQHFEK